MQDSVIGNAIGVIHQALGMCGFDYDRVAIAFSGGKESVVLLHVLAEAGVPLGRVLCVYWQSSDAWPEVVDFVYAETSRLQLRLAVLPLTSLSGVPHAEMYRRGMVDFAERYPQVKMLFMGTRLSDPHGHHFSGGPIQLMSAGWPSLLRVCPLLDWTLEQVWHTIHAKMLPLPVLYAQGHTSLGDSKHEQRHRDESPSLSPLVAPTAAST